MMFEHLFDNIHIGTKAKLKYLVWFYYFTKQPNRPNDDKTPSRKNLVTSIFYFIVSFSITSMFSVAIVYCFGGFNITEFLNSTSIVLIFLLSALIFSAGITLITFLVIKFILKLTANFFELLFAITTQLLLVYASLLPFLYALAHIASFFGSNYLAIVAVFFIACFWVRMFWYGIIIFLTDLYSKSKINIVWKIILAILTLAAFEIISVKYISFAALADSVIDKEKVSNLYSKK